MSSESEQSMKDLSDGFTKKLENANGIVRDMIQIAESIDEFQEFKNAIEMQRKEHESCIHKAMFKTLPTLTGIAKLRYKT